MNKNKHLEKRAVLRLAVFGSAMMLFVVFSLVGLSANSNEAKRRYDSLIAVDQAGGDVEASLNDLRGYIYSHMNTQIGSDTGINPPIQLKGTYERLVEAEKVKVATTNDALYGEAQAYCESTQPTGFSGRNRLDCIEKYVDENGVKEKSIEDDFYKFDFVPPRWSADLAGYSILLASIFGIAFTVDLLFYFRTRSMINK